MRNEWEKSFKLSPRENEADIFADVFELLLLGSTQWAIENGGVSNSNDKLCSVFFAITISGMITRIFRETPQNPKKYNLFVSKLAHSRRSFDAFIQKLDSDSS